MSPIVEIENISKCFGNTVCWKECPSLSRRELSWPSLAKVVRVKARHCAASTVWKPWIKGASECVVMRSPLLGSTCTNCAAT